MSNKEAVVQSVDRALTILEELSKHKEGCGVTALSHVVGLHKSTTHRLLLTLLHRGYVKKDMHTDRYMLGTKLLYLSSALLDSMDLRTIARPYIQKLAADSNETVHLAIREDKEVVYIDKVESGRDYSMRMYSRIGKRVPLYCTAVGKVLLSDMDIREVKALIKENEMIKFTANTIDNHADLEKELCSIAERGYAIDEIEHEQGIRCVAAPVYDREGNVVAAVSIAGLTLFVTKERLPELIEKITETTMTISSQLGH